MQKRWLAAMLMLEQLKARIKVVLHGIGYEN